MENLSCNAPYINMDQMSTNNTDLQEKEKQQSPKPNYYYAQSVTLNKRNNNELLEIISKMNQQTKLKCKTE